MRKITLQRSSNDRLREAFERELNEPQRKAAAAPDGFNLILAGPGSGKTRVITYRVAYLIARGVPAESILLVTFTRRAAREMIHRLETLIGPQAARIWAGTFHHIGNRILRQSAEPLGFASNFTILDSEDQTDLLKLAMDEAGFYGTGSLAPKPATVGNLISLAFNLDTPLAKLIATKSPAISEWSAKIENAAKIYTERKLLANCMDYDDLLGQWLRLIEEFPDQKARLARQFSHILVDEMQDTNLPQLRLVESIAKGGSGNLTAVGDDAQSVYKFRGANYDNILKFPERNPGSKIFRLEINYRSTPEIVAFTNASISHNVSGFPKTLVSARPAGTKPLVIPTADAYEEAELIAQLILEDHEGGLNLNQIAVLYRNHHDSILLQAELVQRGIPYTVRSGLRFFEQAHIKDVLAFLRVISNSRDESAWRRLLLLLQGIGPAKATAIWNAIAATPEPFATLATAPVMAIVPPKSKGVFAGFIADLRKVAATQPEPNPAAAIGAILQGGYSAIVKAKYERPENRLADIEQLGVLAARYESLERLISDLMLAGDVHGVDSLGGETPEGSLVLSTIHQAKGLEWSRVFIPRLIDDGFPSARSLLEEGGEEEERRIFYVGITRAMNELTLVYPLLISRAGRGPTVLTTPSRFLTEIDATLYESATVDSEDDFSWSEGAKTP